MSAPLFFESTFIKAWDSEPNEGLRLQELTGERLDGALIWLPRNVIGKE